jgi:hypothetical protein
LPQHGVGAAAARPAHITLERACAGGGGKGTFTVWNDADLTQVSGWPLLVMAGARALRGRRAF